MDELQFGPVDDPSYYLGTGSSSGGTGINWSGFGDTLTDLAKVYGGVEIARNQQAQRQFYAVGPNGRPYVEGRPGQQYQGGVSPLLMLLIIGGIIYAASK